MFQLCGGGQWRGSGELCIRLYSELVEQSGFIDHAK
jgi:hypothetical protein